MEVFRDIYPDTFYAKFLSHGLRPDGRSLRELRTVTRSMGSLSNSLGSALIKLGKTTVVCGVNGMIGPLEEKQGLVHVHVELTPLSSPDIRPGQVVPQAGVLQGKIAALLLGAGVVPTTQLVVDRGEKPVYWHLQVDVCCIEDDGAVFDACLLACISALKNSELPPLRFDQPSQKFVQSSSGASTRLQLVNPPFALSFALLDSYVVADPCHEEESLAAAHVHVVWNSSDQLCAIDKPGGASIARSELERCAEQARARAKEFFRDW